MFERLEQFKRPQTEGRHKCIFCNKVHNRNQAFFNHIRSHLEERPFRCDACAGCFKSASVLRGHVKTHNTARTKPFECEICDKSFDRKAGLEMHTRTHTRERPYKCSKCASSFATSIGCRRHEKRVHMKPQSVPKFRKDGGNECMFCNKIFKKKGSLILHLRSHISERPFRCLACECCFKQEQTLNRHAQTHKSKMTKHICDICTRSFVRKDLFDIHIRTHTRERPYNCCRCDKSFRTKSHCNYHEKSGVCADDYSQRPVLETSPKKLSDHCKKQNEECIFCLQVFKRRALLFAHIRTHLPERCYQCTFCAGTFKHDSVLYRHFDNVHGNTRPKPFACGICDKSFPNKKRLRMHVQFQKHFSPKN